MAGTMLFNSMEFLIFFPIVTGVFLIIPRKCRYIWLLIASYYFYMSWNPKYAILIAVSTIITFISGLLLGGVEQKWMKQLVMVVSLISNLAILAIFKYADFVLQTLSDIAIHVGLSPIDRRLDLLLPVGISFYTFQALSYTIDVYRGDIRAEKNLLRYALFVSFFPQLVAGPIERSGSLLTQIQKIHELKLWDFKRIRDGFLLIFWGLFQKLVIADRAALLVGHVYDHYLDYGFLELALASVLFAFQIYCDFGGYSNIACGAAQVMGISLMKNFRQPYLATSIKEFWRRWHISLTSWFTDYLYIPLGGNRKGLLRKYLHILIVFTVSGLWHGASWNFVAWGGIHAVYQIVGDMKAKLEQKMRKTAPMDSFSRKLGKMILTFILVDIAWIFFAADDLRHAWHIFQQMSRIFQTTSIYAIGLDRGNWFMLCFGIVVLMIVDLIHEKGKSVFVLIGQQTVWFRWILYLGLIWCIIMFGIYGIGYDTSQFIYFQF
ncbi:MAG: hypothetical protein NC417_00815 [Candidatus Gastranaerophilales bacterium]|nr:hypothetical protein [Candidatus Gastranaerophilales bacterium]